MSPIEKLEAELPAIGEAVSRVMHKTAGAPVAYILIAVPFCAAESGPGPCSMYSNVEGESARILLEGALQYFKLESTPRSKRGN